MSSCEQQARDMLDRMSCANYWIDPQRLSAADVVELANLIADNERLAAELEDSEEERTYCPICGSCGTDGCCGPERCKYPRDTVETLADVERLNQMLRDTGYGQGQIDAYVAQCGVIERLRAGLAKHYDNLRIRASCVVGGYSAEVPPWCVICKGKAPLGKTVSEIQHAADCPVTLAREAAEAAGE